MSRVLSYMLSTPWAMRREDLDVMTLIALRDGAALDRLLAEGERVLADGAESRIAPEAMMGKPGERLVGTRYIQIREGGVAVVDVNGRIAKRLSMFADVCGNGMSTELLLRDFNAALANPNVQSIVFNIDSPGGEAFGINELSQAIYAARGRKPMKAYVSGLGCSGAYWIASACDEIVCDKSAFLGSIGVVMVSIDDTEAYKMAGFDKKVVTSSNAPKKRLDLNTDEGMAEFQSELDAMESIFVGAVARNRKKKKEEVVRDFNQGGVLIGPDAVKAGMADRTGSLEDVIKELARAPRTRASAMSAEHETGEPDMNFKEKVKELAASVGFRVTESDVEAVEAVADEAEAAPETETAIAAETAANPEQNTAAVDADIDAERQRLAAERAEVFASKASAFAEREIVAGRLVPAERAALEAAYAQALADDHAMPAAEGQQSRVATIEAMQAARQPHLFTKETVAPDATYKVLSGDSTPEGGITEERRQELMSKTPLGAASLKLVRK